MKSPSVMRLIEKNAYTNASRTAHPRTSPVALRANSVRSRYGTSPTVVAMQYSFLSAGEHELLDPPRAVEIDDCPKQVSLLVGAPRVDTECVADARISAGLVAVPMERERRLVLLDRFAHGLRTARHGRMARVLELHVLRELGS